MKKFLKKILSERIKGLIDFYILRVGSKICLNGFNGQKKRLEIVRALLTLKPDFILETGTYLGFSTEFLATEAGCPVITIENNTRHFFYAKAKLRKLRSIEIINQDSRNAIRHIIARPGLNGKFPFCYLDAHWYNDLPLAEEIDLICSHWPKAIIMIDDFQVPDDPGYGYDNYGIVNQLTLTYIRPLVSKYGLSVFFPASPSDHETGARRGSVVLVSGTLIKSYIKEITQLREYTLGNI